MLIPELGLVVIDILGSEDSESEFLSHAHSLRALCNCALVCKDWLYRSRVNIYRTVYIQDTCGLESLERTFTMQPSLRTLVESIKLSQVGRMGEGEVPFYMVAMFIQSMSFPVIQGLEIRGARSDPPLPLPSLARACLRLRYPAIHRLRLETIECTRALLLLIALPNLVDLCCNGITGEIKKMRCLNTFNLTRLEVGIQHSISEYALMHTIGWSCQPDLFRCASCVQYAYFAAYYYYANGAE